MAKFHLKKNGEPGICRATKHCPLGEETPHFESETACRKFFENSQDKLLLPKTQKAVNPEATSREERVAYSIPAWGKAIADAKIEKTNKRLAKAGIQERFEITWGEPHFVTKRGEYGIESTELVRDLTLNHPQIAYNGWTLAAVLDQTENGMMVRTVPGVELNGFVPEEKRCDECGKKRERNDTYLVRFEDGTVKQVGSSCLEAFLGVRPPALWAIGMDPLETVDDDFEKARSKGKGEYPQRDTKMVAAVSMVVTNMGQDYHNSKSDNPTSHEVRDILWFQGGPQDRQDARKEVIRRAQELVDSGEVDKVLKAGSEMAGNGTFEMNMRTATGGEHTTYRDTGFVAYSVREWAKNQEKEQPSQPISKPGFVAPLKTKINTIVHSDGKKGIPAVVEMVKHFPNNFGYGGTTTMLIMRTDDGRIVKVNTSTNPDLKKGNKLRIVGGTVSDYGNYENVDQTIITRMKWEPIEEALEE